MLVVLVICLTISIAALSHAERTGGAGFNPQIAAVTHRAAPRRVGTATVATNDAFLFDSIQGDIDRAQNLAVTAIHGLKDSIWECSLWLSNRLTAMLYAFAPPEQSAAISIDLSQVDSAMLGFSLMAVVTLCLAGPLYLGWKSWKIARYRVLRYR